MLYKRRARAAQQEAGPLSPLSQRRQDEFDQIKILLLQNDKMTAQIPIMTMMMIIIQTRETTLFLRWWKEQKF